MHDLRHSSESISASEPFFIVFNHESSEEDHDAAIEWLLSAEEPCLGDLSGDGSVDGADLGLLLGAWGGC